MQRNWQRLQISEQAGAEEAPGAGGGAAPNPELFNKEAPDPVAAPEPTDVDMPEWKKSLSEDLRNSPTLKPFHDIEALAKSYVNTKKMVGGDKIPVPGEHASEDDWREVFTKIGLPETEQDYKIELDKEISEALNEDHFKMLKEEAYKLNILPHQLKGLVSKFHEIDTKAAEEFVQQSSTETIAALDSLKSEWGVAFDANAQRANRLMREVTDEKDWAYIEDKGFTQSPQLLRIFGKLADKMYGEAEIKEGGEIRGGALTPSEALAKIDTLRGEKAYMDGTHPKHSAIIKEIDTLYKMAYPTKTP